MRILRRIAGKARRAGGIVSQSHNPSWRWFNDTNLLTFERRGILSARSKVFTIGSCFALEIRKALRDRGVDVYPKYHDIDLDLERARIGRLPERDNVNHYHTFAIAQEFARFEGSWSQDPDDYWEVTDHWWSGDIAYQDPYRRAVFGRTPRDLLETVEKLNATIKEAILAADAFVFTLGLIEVWRNRKTGLMACMNPGYAQGGGEKETAFHLSTFSENLNNLTRTVDIIHAVKPGCPVIVTVSPVPLGRTFSSSDVYVANVESKSVLRAAAGQLCRDRPDVIYFPSYETCSHLHDVYGEDGRHVRPEVVKRIVLLFERAFMK